MKTQFQPEVVGHLASSESNLLDQILEASDFPLERILRDNPNPRSKETFCAINTILYCTLCDCEVKSPWEHDGYVIFKIQRTK